MPINPVDNSYATSMAKIVLRWTYLTAFTIVLAAISGCDGPYYDDLWKRNHPILPGDAQTQPANQHSQTMP